MMLLLLPSLICITGAKAQAGTAFHGKETGFLFKPAYDTADIMKMINTGKNLGQRLPDSAVQLFGDALNQSRQAGYTFGIAASLSKLADLSIRNGMYDKALGMLREAVLYAQQSERGKKEIASLYNDIARILIYKGEYEKGAAYLYQAAMLTERYQNRQSRIVLGGIYNNLGMALNHMDPDTSSIAKILYYLNLGEKIALAEKDYNLTATILANKGVIYLAREHWDSSRIYFEAAKEIAEKYDLPKIRYGTLTNLAEIYISRGMPEKALPYLQEAVAPQQLVNPYYRITALTSLGQAYYKLNKYDKARKILQNALPEAEALHLSSNLIQIHDLLAQVFVSTGRYQQAYEHQEKLMHIKDSMSSQQVKTNVYQLDIKFRSAQKDKDLLQKELLITRQKNYLEKKNTWITITATGTIVLATLLFSLYRNSRNKQKFQNEKIRILQKEQEISTLKAMMKGEEKERARLARELHDGIGSQLAAIKMNFASVQKEYPALSGIPQISDIIGMVGNTAADVRKTAHNLMPNILTRYGLFGALLSYSNQINKSGQIRIDMRLYGDSEHLDQSFSLLVYRIIQELIQNIIKHARADHAVIQVREEGKMVNIVVEDNGIGFDSTKETEGIGLRQLAGRVRAMQGEMLIDSTPGSGAVVYIELNSTLFETNEI